MQMHHIPTLFVHPAKRIRLLAASIHASFLALAPLNTHISAFLIDTAPTPQLEAILGTWCLAAHDIDKAVAATASASWIPFIARASPRPPPAALARTFEFCQSMLLDPLGTYTYLNPPQPAAPPPPSAPHARAKTAGRNAHGSGRQTPVRQREDPDAARREDEHEETETDRKARLRVAAFGAIAWLLSHQPPTPEHAPVPTEDPTHIEGAAVHALLANPALWTALAHDNSVSVCPAIEAFGLAQPPVRRAAWAFVDVLRGREVCVHRGLVIWLTRFLWTIFNSTE
ncbi:listerin E3 ubiquitin protein ligase 1 [Pleurotus pulmonarius]|nr:listerin E3 ubiquitin protein ligase 1 [Pleurotus pulmonarius]